MRRIIIPVPSGSGTITIPKEKTHYLKNVLRCRTGDEIEIFDGAENKYRAVLRSFSQGTAVADILHSETYPHKSPIELILAQGLLKGDKMDLVIQKTTELGIHGIIPLETERSQIKETRRIARWRKIAEEASRQSGRTSIPFITDTMKYTEFFTVIPFRQNRFPEQGFIFCETKGLHLRDAIDNLESTPSSLLLIIGPEGGFQEEEIRVAENRGFTAVSLGSRILRAETAAIVATALLQFSLGGLQS